MSGERDEAAESERGPVTRTEEEVDREAILARRALFIASAVAGIGLVSCDGPGPFACLEPPAVDAGSGPRSSTPGPCLTVSPPEPPPPDAGASIEPSDAGVRDAATPQPHACLTPKRAP